jgi:perosamine synthetase
MDIDIFKKTIKKEFLFAKSAVNLGELWQRNIDLPGGGCLIPLSHLHLEDEQLVANLGAWRAAASYAYPTRFQVTNEGTKKWMKLGVLDKEDRLLFLIHDEFGRPVGHAGFANGLNEQGLLELDNILRGENFARKGIISEAIIALQNWGKNVLFADGFYLRVLASNTHAVSFYDKLGYVEVERDPLKMIVEEGIEKLVPTNASEGSDAFIRMVPGVDNKAGSQMILTAGPSIGLREQVYAGDAARKGWNSQWDKYLKAFEEEFARYVGVKYAIATSSCTGALHIALAALDVGPGDEVIVPDITWVATANAVLYVGATPIFADVDAETWCIDPVSVESLITPRTKAIIPVHLYGQPSDMDAIMLLAERHKLFVVEDAAPSIGAECKGRRTGSFGHFSAFSFQGAKLAVTGEGGMLVTNDEALFKRAYTIWDQGRTPGTFWIETNGFKYKMSNIQAAIGLGQLQRNDEMVEAKRRNFARYQMNLEGVKGIRLYPEPSWAKSICWMTSILVTEDAKVSRDEMIKQLKARNVDSRPVFPAISQYPIWPVKQEPKPMAKYVGERAINLPSGVCLSQAEVDYVCKQVMDILK